MNRSAKGRRNEDRSRQLLERQGYRVTRAAASKGEWDLVATGPDDVVLVQVKSNAWPGSEEMHRPRACRAPTTCSKVVRRWRDRQPEPDGRVMG